MESIETRGSSRNLQCSLTVIPKRLGDALTTLFLRFSTQKARYHGRLQF